MISEWDRKKKKSRITRTVAFDHEGLDDIVSDQLEIRMADPMGDARLGTGEEIIEHGHLVAKEHETIDQMRTDKASATGDENALTT